MKNLIHTVMKKLFFLLSIVFSFIACEKTPDVVISKGQLDPNAKIILHAPKVNPSAVSAPQFAIRKGYTGLQVVQEAVNIKFRTHWLGSNYHSAEILSARTFGDYLKDFDKPALLMWGTDIITQQGEFYKDFIYGYNVVITDNHNDTIAFVPDSMINNARPLIEAAYNDSNYTEVYRIFNEAFTFYPYPEGE
jgi:hypothetical protein